MAAFSRILFRLSSALVLVIASGALFLWFRPHPIAGSGGLPLPGRILIPVPQFLQGDPRWGSDPLGDTPGTLAGEGCAVASAAMVLARAGAERMKYDASHLTPEGCRIVTEEVVRVLDDLGCLPMDEAA